MESNTFADDTNKFIQNISSTEILQWDVVNWERAIKFWEKKLGTDYFVDKKALELGATAGGMSLWLAGMGAKVVCSDLQNPEEKALPSHSKYKFKNEIEYVIVDARDIPYENEFDIIIFKSVLGGVGWDNRKDLQVKAINEIYKALKPGGVLLFVENLKSTALHMMARKMFLWYGNLWRYIGLNEMNEIFGIFPKIECKTTGFLGTFGRSETQRNFLGKIDGIISPILPKSFRYIIFGIATK